MREQVDDPEAAAALVVRAGVLLARPGGAAVADLDEDVHVALYTVTREVRIRDQAEVAVYLELWRKLGADAVFDDDARDLLRSLATEFLAE